MRAISRGPHSDQQFHNRQNPVLNLVAVHEALDTGKLGNLRGHPDEQLGPREDNRQFAGVGRISKFNRERHAACVGR